VIKIGPQKSTMFVKRVKVTVFKLVFVKFEKIKRNYS